MAVINTLQTVISILVLNKTLNPYNANSHIIEFITRVNVFLNNLYNKKIKNTTVKNSSSCTIILS